MTMRETELTFYAKIGNFQGLEQAVSSEVQAQFSYTLPAKEGMPESRVRVRSTAKDGVIQYEETIKSPIENKETKTFGCDEHTTIINEEYFEAWKKTYPCSGVDKIRYVFLSKEVELDVGDGKIVKLPEIKYEVDVFLNRQGQRSAWCKIDIEIDKLLDTLKEQHAEVKQFDTVVKLSSLPFNPQHAFSGKSEKEEERQAVDHFWDTFSYQPGEQK